MRLLEKSLESSSCCMSAFSSSFPRALMPTETVPHYYAESVSVESKETRAYVVAGLILRKDRSRERDGGVICASTAIMNE